MKFTKKEIREATLAAGISIRRADAIIAILIENRKAKDSKKNTESTTTFFDMRTRFSAAKAAKQRLPIYDVTINGTRRGIVTDIMVSQSIWTSTTYALILDGKLVTYDSLVPVVVHSVI